MPFFRDYQAFGNTQIAPFHDLTGKAYYLIKLLWPLGFLPLVFWRYGILALPAIGVNLLSGRPGMYSTGFHYDDISSTLLLMSCALILIEKRIKIADWLGRKWLKGVFIFWIVGVLVQLPSSPIRILRYAVPNSYHLNFLEEIWYFDNNHPNDSLAVQSTIGPHIHRHNITIMTQQHTGECSPPKISGSAVKYILLSPDVGHYLINDIEKCIKYLEDNSLYNRFNKFKYLNVFKHSTQ